MRTLVLSLMLFWSLRGLGNQFVVDFHDLATGQTPTNFTSVVAGGGKRGEWTVLSDAVPPMFAPFSPQAPQVTSRPVLAQVSQDPTDERFPILIYDGETFKDFKLSARFKIVSGVQEQMAGVVFRYQNPSNFFVVRASALGRNLGFYAVTDGRRLKSPVGPPLVVTSGVWHTLHVECVGTKITFGLDDNPRFAVEDGTFEMGKIGFWTKSDSVTYFSDLDVDYKPIIPAAQSIVNAVFQIESRLLGLKVYALNNQGEAKVIASTAAAEVGQPGGAAEKNAITNGTVSIAWGKGTVSVWLPLQDRNGESMAAVVVRQKTFPGETQDTAITRGRMVIQRMEKLVGNSDEFLK